MFFVKVIKFLYKFFWKYFYFVFCLNKFNYNCCCFVIYSIFYFFNVCFNVYKFFWYWFKGFLIFFLICCSGCCKCFFMEWIFKCNYFIFRKFFFIKIIFYKFYGSFVCFSVGVIEKYFVKFRNFSKFFC